MAYANLSKAELQKVFDELSAEYKGYQAKNLSLNMARGKPSAKQLELALGVLEALKARSEFANSNGDDCRNYGLWDGLPEMKRIFADMVGVPASQVILGNNSSLMMMFEVISRGFSHGYNGCTPWCKLDKKKFLCPVPGYDRHFAVTEYTASSLSTSRCVLPARIWISSKSSSRTMTPSRAFGVCRSIRTPRVSRIPMRLSAVSPH